MLKTVSTQLALASDTLPEVLAKGNTTGGTDLAVSSGDDITFADNSKAIFGAGSDISIYSDGSTGQVTGNVNVTGDATFSGSVGIGGAPTEKLDISQSVNNAVIAKVTNTNSGDLASARVEIYNNNSSLGQLTTYSSGFAYNVLGSSAANWTFLGASGANSNGLKIGTLTADPVVFGTSDLERMRLDASGNLLAGGDNTQTLGGASNRWSVVYAGTGTINTSDAREKTAVSALTPDEVEASKQLGKEIGTYKWLSVIAEKGDAARTHIGMTVQRAIEIMTANNLDPTAYGFICYDAWDDEFVDRPAIEAQEATEDTPAVEAVAAWNEQTKAAGDRYGFRYDELLAFIAAGFNARLEALEGAK